MSALRPLSSALATYPSLRGQRVFITGGGTGIGAAIVTAFCQQGAQVAFVDVAEAESAALAKSLADAGLPVPWWRVCDVRDVAALQGAIAQASAELGDFATLVNNVARDDRHTIESVTPEYWDEACKHLGKRDRVMRKLIPQFGEGRLQSRGDAFTTLARSIVGQQISVKAAQSVWDRFVALVKEQSTRLAPASVLALDTPTMRSAGLSARKVEYLNDLAQHFESGTVHVRQWQQMDDEAIIEELVAIRGIGRWTAEMFLIFHLMRPNVLPLDDLGLLKGISLNYFSGEPVSRAEAREVGDAWAPFRSVATWYIWRSLDPLPVDY